MNKSALWLLVFAVCIGFTFGFQEFDVEETVMNKGFSDASSSHLQVAAPWYSFITNWIHNQNFFFLRVIYDLYCFSLATTYVFWFNDGGANFYKCYRSVPQRVQFY